ncbi:MAG: hypothetical protein PVI33_01475 [Candidatus Omnitrophota bacterium]|jgi:Flp pilus assembly pilin Flp
MKYKLLKAMSVIEYSFLIAVIVAALLGIQTYLKRAVSARWRQSADTFGFGRQYELDRSEGSLIWE